MNWNFDYSYTKLPNIYYSNVKPDIYEKPKLLLFNHDLANELDMDFNNNNDHEICDFLLGKTSEMYWKNKGDCQLRNYNWTEAFQCLNGGRKKIKT